MSQSKPVNSSDPALPRSPIMTLEQVAEYLQCHPSTVYRLLKKRAIPAFKIGSDWRFNRDSIDQWSREAEAKQRAIETRVG